MRITKFLLSVFFVSLLPGCSLAYLPYFRNLTDKPVELTVMLSEEDQGDREYFLYTDEIVDINRKAYKKLDDSLQLSFDGDTASLLVPPRSTVLLRSAMIMGRGLQLLLRQDDRVDTIGNAVHQNSFKNAPRGRSLAILIYYDYKQN